MKLVLEKITSKQEASFKCDHFQSQNFGYSSTCNTVNKAAQIESKLLRCSLVNFPPNICIPRSAKINMKRKRTTRSDMMDRNCDTRECTKLLMERQYLE